tara:strand:+ start:373 stop:996 length:624 start_codon:yes stop_codon:yes gene_type:complete
MVEIGDVEPVYLDMPNVVDWQRDLPRLASAGALYFPRDDIVRNDGSTEPISVREFEQIGRPVGDYIVNASAVLYDANVALIPPGRRWIHSEESQTNTPEPAVLYDGSISFYHQGEIPGTKGLVGLDFITQGRLHGAAFKSDPDVETGGLHYFIFGGVESLERVEQILRGYLNQDRAERDAELRADNESFNSGVQSAGFLARHGGPPI